MRRRILTLLLAALAVAIAVPLGAAWSSSDRRISPGPAVLAESVVLPPQPLTNRAFEAMTLLLTGTILFGLGVVVRKSR
jgi:hypothetical protein